MLYRLVGASFGIAIALAAAGCEKTPSPISNTPQPQPWAANAAPTAPGMAAPDPSASPSAPAPADDGGGLSGTVLETMDSGGYTYAKLDTGAHGQVWVAGPLTKLAAGMTLGRMTGQQMTAFRSNSLNRTFDEIFFVSDYAIHGGAAPAATVAPAGNDALSGTVTETMSSGGYTYALVDHGGTKVWIAGPESKLAVGAKLGAMSGSLMTGFRSDTLKRTFDQIYFVSGFAPAGSAASATPAVAADPHAAAATAAPPIPVEKIAPVAGGMAIADVFAKTAAFVGKPVAVRGKVVKVNDGILGRNWLHVRDGSGGPGTNDLLVTSAATAKVGDVITARGTVATNKDFGAGYKYDVLLEDAALTP